MKKVSLLGMFCGVLLLASCSATTYPVYPAYPAYAEPIVDANQPNLATYNELAYEHTNWFVSLLQDWNLVINYGDNIAVDQSWNFMTLKASIARLYQQLYYSQKISKIL